MVIRVEYYIPKKHFVKHKNKLKRELYNLAFKISTMKFEKGISDIEISKHEKMLILMVRKILSYTCEQI